MFDPQTGTVGPLTLVSGDTRGECGTLLSMFLEAPQHFFEGFGSKENFIWTFFDKTSDFSYAFSPLTSIFIFWAVNAIYIIICICYRTNSALSSAVYKGH